ncbi:unnamed protein product, partial [marine sediment metagenome]
KPKYEVIEKTLDKITKKPRTKAVYRSYINMYFKLLKVSNPNEYFTDKRNYTADMWKVADEIINMPPKTQQTFISCVKRFLIRNDVEIKTMEWQDIYSRNELNEAYALTNDVIPKPEQLKRLLQLANPKIKTLAVFLATTGCRLNEALQLTWNDIDMDSRMIKLSPEIVKRRGEKGRRYTFFTEETKDLLESWKQERVRFLKNSMNKSIYVRNRLETQGYKIKRENNKFKIYKNGKKIDKKEIIALEQRIFPFSSQTATVSWHGLLEKA